VLPVRSRVAYPVVETGEFHARLVPVDRSFLLSRHLPVQSLQLLLVLSIETGVIHPPVFGHDERRETHVECRYPALVDFLHRLDDAFTFKRDGHEMLAALGFRDGYLPYLLVKRAVIAVFEPRIDLRELDSLVLEVDLDVVIDVVRRV